VFTLNANEQNIALDLPGDADLDDDVDFDDLSALARYYGHLNDMMWMQGDFDGDGDVDLIDLTRLATYYQGGASQAMADFQSLTSKVPEPSMLGVALLGLTLMRRRRHGI
jgi:hypothetical protein